MSLKMLFFKELHFPLTYKLKVKIYQTWSLFLLKRFFSAGLTTIWSKLAAPEESETLAKTSTTLSVTQSCSTRLPPRTAVWTCLPWMWVSACVQNITVVYISGWWCNCPCYIQVCVLPCRKVILISVQSRCWTRPTKSGAESLSDQKTWSRAINVWTSPLSPTSLIPAPPLNLSKSGLLSEVLLKRLAMKRVGYSTYQPYGMHSACNVPSCNISLSRTVIILHANTSYSSYRFL